jgi:hypothetical protein
MSSPRDLAINTEVAEEQFTLSLKEKLPGKHGKIANWVIIPSLS